MSKFTEHLWSDLVEEHGATIEDTPRPEAAPFLRRPGVLAGGTLVLAAAGTAVGLLVGAGGVTPAAPSPQPAALPTATLPTAATHAPATYTVSVSKTTDGAVLIRLSKFEGISDANAKLAKMGIKEQIGLYMGTGPARVPGPVTCTTGPGAHLPPDAPKVRILIGDNGTEVIGPGETVGNTGVGTWHLISCLVGDDAGNSGVG